MSGRVSDCVSAGRIGLFLWVVCCRLFSHRDFGVQGALTRRARSTPCHLTRGGTHSHSLVTTHSPTLLAGSGLDGRGFAPCTPGVANRGLRPVHWLRLRPLGSGREVAPTLFCLGCVVLFAHPSQPRFQNANTAGPPARSYLTVSTLPPGLKAEFCGKRLFASPTSHALQRPHEQLLH